MAFNSINKACSTCKNELAASEFFKNQSKPDGLTSQCKWCAKRSNAPALERHNRSRRNNPNFWTINKKYQIKVKYGLSLEDFYGLVEKQAGRCAICDKQPKTILYIDHDHTTGLVRGLLCSRCNMALGVLGDCAEGLKRALKYLETPLVIK